jgi:alpha-mannosidase
VNQGPDRSSWDLLPHWQCELPQGAPGPALSHPWGARHRPDWHRRGLVIWPRGGQWRCLSLRLVRPPTWEAWAGAACGRLCLRWWADRVELWVDAELVHRGDLFDTACRWPLPDRWWHGNPLQLELRLRSPLHDDGALISSRLELEPLEPADPHNLLEPTRAALRELAADASGPAGRVGPSGRPLVHLLGHAHLDLAWLWPVADTWQAAERTFASALDLMERYPELHFAHSTPALQAWLAQHRPALFARLQEAAALGRFEPINGPWVETDCQLPASASLLRQFQLGQSESRRLFPRVVHNLAWLPDSFGFAAGLPAIATSCGVRWFCTHKLAWNAGNPFPHRLFRWRSRCGAELLALMNAPIGTDGDPLAIARYRLEWQQTTGLAEALWLPGVGDHGGGPTAEMLDQLRLWADREEAPAQRHGTLRGYLGRLEPAVSAWPVWRDELYLELHRGCATTRPDQKRHSRTLERLLREAELARVLAGVAGELDWTPLLFQQFHDILPGTSIPEVFEQAEPQWRQARRQVRSARDRALHGWLGAGPADPIPASGPRPWWLAQLQPLESRLSCLRLPGGEWSLGGRPLASQPALAGGVWVQLPGLAGVAAVQIHQSCNAPRSRRSDDNGPAPPPEAEDPVTVAVDGDRLLITNRSLRVQLGPDGVEQLWGADGREQLASPLEFRRYRDAGEFWDAWDIAADYADHPLPWRWQGKPELVEWGPLCVSFRWRGVCGGSAVRLDGRLLAGSRCLELSVSVDWRQRHELLRFEIPLAFKACRWAADSSGGVIERPADPVTPRERQRWEVTAVSWLCSIAGPGPQPGGLAVLLDGPQGVSGAADRLGVSLLRAPTWPDPGADNGLQRQRLALLPYEESWSSAQIPGEALRLREPLWRRPGIATANDPGQACGFQGLPPLPPGLVMISLRPGSQAAVLTVQNLSPVRRWLELGPRWRLLARTDGLDNPWSPQPAAAELGLLRPWELGFWRVEALADARFP